MDKILKYIEELCKDAGLSDGTEMMDIGPLNANLISYVIRSTSREYMFKFSPEIYSKSFRKLRRPKGGAMLLTY